MLVDSAYTNFCDEIYPPLVALPICCFQTSFSVQASIDFDRGGGSDVVCGGVAAYPG